MLARWLACVLPALASLFFVLSGQQATLLCFLLFAPKNVSGNDINVCSSGLSLKGLCVVNNRVFFLKCVVHAIDWIHGN